MTLGPAYDRRLSFCCADCRKRLTPVSVRFLGRKVLEEFVAAGAPDDILWEAHPHIGTFRLVTMVESLRRLHSAEQIESWLTLATEGAFPALAGSLMENHYDRRYEKHRARFSRPEDRELSTDSLKEDALQRLADQIADMLGSA